MNFPPLKQSYNTYHSYQDKHKSSQLNTAGTITSGPLLYF